MCLQHFLSKTPRVIQDALNNGKSLEDFDI
ncbi:H-NS family nucleoid-associated regulatory protein [Vibrio tritonius]